MSLHYDTRDMRVENFEDWMRRVDEESHYENAVLFESFILRLTVTRPTDTGFLGERELEVAIARNKRYQETVGGLAIPHAFQRSMLGLSTNVFPRSTDAAFELALARIREGGRGDRRHGH